MAKLVVFRGDAVESELHLGGQTLRIGRDGGNEIVLDDKSVSRVHAEVRNEAGTWVIVDLKSRNGVWLQGQQVKKKTPLAFGVPVTIGAYELTIEDDVSTADFGDAASLTSQRTVSGSTVGGATDRLNKPSRSATLVLSNTASGGAKRKVILGSAVAAIVVIAGLAFVLLRDRGLPAETVATTDTTTTAPASPAPVDNPPVQPAPQTAPEVKPPLSTPPAAPKPPQVAAAAPEIETPGITRKPGESWPDYTARATRVQTNFQEGQKSLEKQELGAAIARFQSVERDQKGYQSVDAILRDMIGKQQTALAEALDGGQKNEQADKVGDALKWYQRALVIDPNSAIARQRTAVLSERVALAAFEDAEVLRKRGESAKAIQGYQQVFDLLPRGHEKSREARKYLDTLKP